MNSATKVLPQNPYDALSEKRWHDAYAQCLRIQPFRTFNSDDIDKNLVYARILGYLILEAPTHGGRDYVSNEILSCEGDESRLHDFAELFLLTLQTIHGLGTSDNKCTTPGRRSYPENRREIYFPPAGEDPQNHTCAKRSALERDSYRCMVTHVHDVLHYGWMLTATEKADSRKQRGPDTLIMGSHACHIIPLVPAQCPNRFNSTLNFILNFCSLSLDEFNKATHSLTNIMTLSSLIGPFITGLDAWFDAVPDANNTYYIHSWLTNILLDMPPRITFSTKTNLPLPDPRYLKIHAAVCRVFQWSGARVHLYLEQEKSMKDTESA